MAPTPDRPWADSPLELITTPQFATKKTDLFTKGATHMCLLHNSIFRGYNSIYHQALHVKEADKADFIGYCLTWFKFVKSHHDDEEAVLFVKVEELLDDKEVWAETHKEHEAFLPGLVAFHDYLTSLPSPAAFSGARLREIMATFQDSFSAHFHSEISHIASLGSHPRAPAPGSPEEAEAGLVFQAWGKATVMKAGTADVVPFFLMILDGSPDIAEGMWASWPPMPKPVRWGLVNVAGAWHGGWWKFASCDGMGGRRQLHAAVAEEEPVPEQNKDAPGDEL
jgi:hypothetical protein